MRPLEHDTGETQINPDDKDESITEDFHSKSERLTQSAGWKTGREMFQPGLSADSLPTSDGVELESQSLLLNTSKHLYDLIKSHQPNDIYSIKATAALASELHKLLRLQFDVIREARKGRLR